MYKLNKESAIKKTLELVDKPINEWITFNYKLNIKVFNDNDLVDIQTFMLEKDENPILESKIEANYLLITTTKIYSIFQGKIDEMTLFDFEGFGDEYDKINYSVVNGKYPKTNIISVKRQNKNNLLFEIDSFYPANFVKMLILNINSYIKFGKWFWKNDIPER